MNPCLPRIVCPLLALCLLAPAAGLWAQASLDGPQILARIDKTMNAPSDQRLEATLKLIAKDGSTMEREIEMLQKGSDRRLVRFLSPADQKGIAVLSLPDGVIYLYLPAFKKVKRIASHVKNSSFAGTDFTYDDMEAKRYAEHYDARLVREEGGQLLLELSPKKPSESDYARLMMWVRSDNFVPVTIEYYNKGGTLSRRLTSDRIEKIGAYWVAREREMTDLATGHRSRMILTRVGFDTGLADELFTTRNLER